jgi:sortase (surface protein transpeptidase)
MSSSRQDRVTTTLSVLQPTSERTLTLITCYPFFYVGSAPIDSS